jgi:AcrR family transcriptional regulator
MSRDKAKREPVRLPPWLPEDTPRSRKHPLVRSAVVRVALVLADAEGIDAVSMRRVASELDMGTMTLYSYVRNKEDLLVLCADEIGKEMLVADPLPEDWREALRAIARRTREMMLRHPWLATLDHGPFISPSIARHIEQSLSALSGLGMPPADTMAILQAVDAYILGSAVDELEDRVRDDHIEDWEAQQTELLRLASDHDDLPHLERWLEDGMFASGHDFERGLNWLLAGIAADLESRPRGRARRTPREQRIARSNPPRRGRGWVPSAAARRSTLRSHGDSRKSAQCRRVQAVQGVREAR